MQILAGFLLAMLISTLAWRMGSLSRSGTLAAVILGTIVFGLGGLPWAVLLVGFFASSSALSRLFRHRKHSLSEKFAKGSQRAAIQVLANGGPAGLFVILHHLCPLAAWPWLGYVASLAAANSDTWATELGVLSQKAPRLITTGKTVPRGTSGGITPLGTMAAVGGALFIALLAVIFQPAAVPGEMMTIVSASAGLIFTLAGLAGSMVDSLLGAALQAVYFCPSCGKETEHYPEHTCGGDTHLIRGRRWMDNDMVNALSALAAAGIAGVLSIYWR